MDLSSRVLLDANILFPVSLRNLLLNLADGGLYQVYWQAQILEETRRNLIEKAKVSEEYAANLIKNMQAYFPEATISDEYRNLEASLTNEPKDRHVLAAAVASGSRYIVTFNLKDFPPASLAPHNVQALLPDDFLIQCFNTDRVKVLKVIEEQAANLKDPPLTVQQVLDVLAKHAPSFVALVRPELNFE